MGITVFARNLDPRLKMGVALLLGPLVWLVTPVAAGLLTLLLAPLVVGLAVEQPMGAKMLRSIAFFLLFWVLAKALLDGTSGIPPETLFMSAGILGLRLTALILLGLGLALSTSARALGLSVAWILRPLVGGERAWKVALSLALVVHFLPLCLTTMGEVRSTVGRRCPGMGFLKRMTVIPQAVVRNLGQKTWNQTLAIAGRGLEGADAWRSDFDWSRRDTGGAVLATLFIFAIVCLC